jgi:hypothetical protein
MKVLFVRHFWSLAGGVVILLAVCSILVHPFGTPKQINGHKRLGDDPKPPPEVTAILNRSCLDCHSNQTVWPWYSYVAPMSWLIEKDVQRGRDRMNLSEWQQYTFQQREKLWADIASVVKNREMPLFQYTLIHRHARLSDAETDIVYGWARAERRKLKTASHPSAHLIAKKVPEREYFAGRLGTAR